MRWTALLLTLITCSALTGQSLVEARNLADGTLISDQVARKVGDLITVRIEESMSIKDESTTDTSRENEVEAFVEMAPNTARVRSSVGQSTVGQLPAFAATSEKTFTGEGKFNSTGDVRTTITARVVDVLDNGNLVIEGRRKLVIQNETKTILVTGVCRNADIDTDNFVSSLRLHNFKTSIEGEGPLSRAQQEGILGRALDFIWPF